MLTSHFCIVWKDKIDTDVSTCTLPSVDNVRICCQLIRPTLLTFTSPTQAFIDDAKRFVSAAS